MVRVLVMIQFSQWPCEANRCVCCAFCCAGARYQTSCTQRSTATGRHPMVMGAVFYSYGYGCDDDDDDDASCLHFIYNCTNIYTPIVFALVLVCVCVCTHRKFDRSHRK